MPETPTPRRIWGLVPNVFFLGLVSFFNDFSSQMVYAVMPVFLTVTLGATPAFVGLLEGFADALASILRIVSGWWSDRIGKRKALSVFGYGLSTSTRWFLALTTGFWQVFGLRVIDRIGKGVREAPRDALLSESVSHAETGVSFGFNRMLDAAGGILGPIAALIILPLVASNYRQLFLIAAALGIIALLLFFFVREVKSSTEIKLQERPPFQFSIGQFSAVFKRYILSVFVFGLGFMPLTLILLKGSGSSSAGQLVPLLFVIYSLVFSLAATPFGKIADRIGERGVLRIGFATAIVGYLVLAFTTSFISTIAGFVILGLYSAMTDGVERALARKLLPDSQLARGHGFLQASVGIASLLAGIIGGLIWTWFGPAAAFSYGAIMMFIGLLVFMSLSGSENAIGANR